MTTTEIDRTLTSIECPGRDCSEKLHKVTRRVDGTPKVFDDYECPVNRNHVTQQWEPPGEI